MTMPALFLENLQTDHVPIRIEGENAHILASVLRAEVGETVYLLNGRGLAIRAKITELSRKQVALQPIESQQEISAPTPRITLCQAWPKGDRAKEVVEKVSQMGIDQILFFASERCISRPIDEAKKIEKLGNTAVEGMRLAKGRWLTQLKACKDFAALLSHLPGNTLRIVLWEEASTAAPLREVLQKNPHPIEVAILIGPEGGLTSAEVQTAQAAGFHLATLGKPILATDTAAIAACGFVTFWYR